MHPSPRRRPTRRLHPSPDGARRADCTRDCNRGLVGRRAAVGGGVRMNVKSSTPTGETSADIELDDAIFAAKVNVPLMHQVVTAQLAAARAGTHSTKTRGEVRGGGAKPWRQKGTGRARHGSSREPQWKGGGIAFGPKPRDHSQSVPKKMKAAALRSALSVRANDGKRVRRRRARVRAAEDEGRDRRAQGVGGRGQGAARPHARRTGSTALRVPQPAAGPRDRRAPAQRLRRHERRQRRLRPRRGRGAAVTSGKTARRRRADASRRR